ncbi:MAG: ribonuclease HII [Kiritimatiellia bacterium]
MVLFHVSLILFIAMLTYEGQLWSRTPALVLAGVDEAGRGCLAGPVVAGAVSMSADTAEFLYKGELAALTDSKKLTVAKREFFFKLLAANQDVSLSTGWCSSQEIDDLNILSATHLAMRRALENMPLKPQYALIDGLPVKGLPCESEAIVKGDSKSFLIAAASVAAKVLRDRYMVELDQKYPGYGFAEHKGYGTSRHISALHSLGACCWHRRSFRPVQDVIHCLPGFEWE